MRAILMAAGIGSRLSKKPTMPKCLWELGGEPLIRHTVKMLTANGIEVHLIVGFMQDMVRTALADLPVVYHYNPFFRVTNSIGSLWFAREALDGKEDLILGNADVYWEQPLLDMLKGCRENAVMLGDKKRVELGDYFFQTNAAGHIVGYGKQLPRDKRDCEYVGLCVLKKDFVSGFRQRMEDMIADEAYDLWWENVLYKYCEEYPVSVRDVGENFWGEIDYLQDYDRITGYIESRKGTKNKENNV